MKSMSVTQRKIVDSQVKDLDEYTCEVFTRMDIGYRSGLCKVNAKNKGLNR